MEYKIAIPSKGRAGLVTTSKIFTDAFIYVPSSEVEQYKPFHKNIIGVPDHIKGITATRNYILKSNDCNIFFIDDDLQYMGYVERTKTKYKVKRLTNQDLAKKEIEKLFDICYQTGSKINGFFTVGNNLTNYSYNPFLFNGVCLGSCMGVVNDGEFYFDEEFEVKEDYELTLRHLKEKGLTVRSNVIFMQHEHTQMSGGCRDSKRIEKEKKAILELVKRYPNWIKSAKHRGTSFAIQLNL